MKVMVESEHYVDDEYVTISVCPEERGYGPGYLKIHVDSEEIRRKNLEALT